MSVAQQAKAARRKARIDMRYHTGNKQAGYRARRSRSGGIYLNASQKRAAARGRKRVQMGGRAGSVGFKVK